MFRLSKILFFIFLGLSVFLIVIHIQISDYFQNPSKSIVEKIYEGQTNISIYLSKYENDHYTFHVSFNNIRSDIFVNEMKVQIVKANENIQDSLYLVKILPYSGMHPWDIPEFKSFSEIPSNLRKLNTESNPYFAYDFIFGRDTKIGGNDFSININFKLSENGTEKQITKELTIKRISKMELKPLDAHSDISFLLIPVTGILTIIFALVWFIKRRIKNG